MSSRRDRSRLSNVTTARGDGVCQNDRIHPEFQSFEKVKLEALWNALESDPVDVAALRKLAISRGGLLTNEVRRRAWPKLLNIDPEDDTYKKRVNIKEHRDYDQVVLDVNRSLARFPPGMEDGERLVLQDELVEVIVRILTENPQLHYYQGYHDICVTFLLVVGKEASVSLVNVLSLHHLREFMDETMDRTRHMLNYLLPIIHRSKPALYEFMKRSEVGTVFAVAWLITWYGHVLNNLPNIIRLYDFFLACHPLMPIYLAAAIVLYREEDIMQCECEMPYVHCCLSKIPPNLPLERLIVDAGDLYVQYQPDQLVEDASKWYAESNLPQVRIPPKKRQPVSLYGRLALQAAKLRQGNTGTVRLAAWTISVGLCAVALAALNSTLRSWA